MNTAIVVGIVALVVSIIILLMRKDVRERAVPGGKLSSDISLDQERPHISYSTLEDIRIVQGSFLKLLQQLQKKVIGQDGFIYGLFVSLLVPGGHVLVEGVPGLAKTRTIASLADAVALSFSRIQFTPDMLPGDITGIEMYNTEKKQFDVLPGPLFAHIVLADEINRATPKVQSALLEAMQEQQVTIGNDTLPLPAPFFVLATQNPIEHEGTYALPEAQLDRFLMKILVGYPTTEQEKRILTLIEHDTHTMQAVMNVDTLKQAQQDVRDVRIDDEIKSMIVGWVETTRTHDGFQYGASPRASIALMQASKAVAWLEGRTHVLRQDVEKVYLPILRHRVLLTYAVQAQGKTVDEVLKEII